MNSEQRLAAIVSALEQVGLTVLVMGGHAVRYYGLHRDTIDYDLHLSPADWNDLAARLAQSKQFGDTPIPGPSWRPDSFQRFLLGRLPDGRDEWLEFWRDNHLLPSFAEAHARREQGQYGGRTIAFLGLSDLIRSKETARDKDWQDVLILEEFHDARLLNHAATGVIAVEQALAKLRSRRGLETATQSGLLKDSVRVRSALAQTNLSLTQAILLPGAGSEAMPSPATVPLEPILIEKLRTLEPASALHLALVEVVRRRYRQAMQDADVADKEAIAARQARSNVQE